MKYLYDIVSRSSKKFSNRVALVEVGGAQVTYAALEKKTQNLTQKLKDSGIGTDSRIGILAPKKIETAIGMLAASMAGAVYVPMDAEAPPCRNLFILENCQLNALLIDEGLLPVYKELLQKQYRTIDLPELKGFSLFLTPASPPSPLTPDPWPLTSDSSPLTPDPSPPHAFILYTSGSTGKPKGIHVTHENALSFVLWASETFEFSENDVFASIAPFHFDLSVFDLYVAFLNGAKIQLIDAKTRRNPRMLSQLIEQRQISVWYSTPTLLNLMLNYGKLSRYEHRSLRYVLFAGEVFPILQLKALKEAWPQATFYNLYGPAETNVVTWFKIPDLIGNRNQPFPIGKACSFASLKIVGPKAESREGELWISGPSVSPGYVQDTKNNMEKFKVDADGQRWYKTGDWVRLEKDGHLTFVGRKDRMLKRNGYRIELAEIEMALHQHPAILAAAVKSEFLPNGKPTIIAFFQLKPGQGAEEIDLIELQQFCLDQIPKYMLPDRFILVDELPQTSTQKVDYQKLHAG